MCNFGLSASQLKDNPWDGEYDNMIVPVWILELQTRVHTKVRNCGEGPYLGYGLLLIESARLLGLAQCQ